MMIRKESSPSFFVQNSNIRILKSSVKIIVFFASALYLFGYSITGFNISYYVIDGMTVINGAWDSIVPIERVLTFFCGLCLSLMLGKELVNLWRLSKNVK